MELGESAEETALREVLEETGLVVRALTLEGVYSGPGHFTTAPNGDQIESVTIAYSSLEISGELQVNLGESLAFEFARPEDRYGEIRENYRAILDGYQKRTVVFDAFGCFSRKWEGRCGGVD